MKNTFNNVNLNKDMSFLGNDGVYHYLYKITNLINGKFYYGVHNTQNLNDNYIGSGTYLHKAYKKYGLESFNKVILEYFNTEEEMFQREFEIVNEKLILDKNCYNISIGGGRSLFNQSVVKDKNGKIYKVLLDDPRLKTGELVGIAKDTITVKDIEGNNFRISKELFENNRDIFNGTTIGKVIVYDKDMNSFMVDKNDPRYLSGELTFLLKTINKDMTTAKDDNGNCYRIHKDDPRLKTGELIGITKNQIKIIKNNNIKTIDPSELEKYEAEGWKRGSLQENMIIIFKENHQKFIDPSELEKYEAEGWKRGSINKGKCKILKNNVLKTINIDELEKYEAEGWIHTNKTKGKVSITKNNKNKRVHPSELEKYEAEGWKRGLK